MRLTRDDERARRICSLALDFMNAETPLPSSDVARAHYPGLSPDSFRKAFSRDRTMLAACGIVIVERKCAGDESLWEADGERSFARGAELSPTDAAALELACRPLVDDGTFPLADELRFALAKLSRAFSEELVAERSRVVQPSRTLDTLRSCLTERTAARVTYQNARGERTERTLAPYGFFGLRGALYLVAAQLDEKDDDLRTFRVDRFVDARPLKGTTYSVPEDFSVEDWRRLPFQMGPTTLDARFAVPDEREADLRRAAGAQGLFSRSEEGLVWTVPASDAEAAASWAIAMGIRPVEPECLVEAWKRALEGVLGDGR